VRELNAETGVTFLVVTHDPAVSAETARTVRLEHGRIAEVVA
jgi:predicted ABC-type transport system involved in lysophospholipase L1 biosynthesis ATPase subunit